MMLYQSHSPEETVRLGKQFAASLRDDNVVALTGDLGTGKTHFIAGMCEGLGVRGHVASPTFTIINEYPSEGRTVVHVDLYRIASSRELHELGVEEYFGERFICLIEWAERMAEYLPRSYIQVKLAYGEQDNDRLIVIEQVHTVVAQMNDVVP
jgi:tRNA threonylcarbamoyladenosine biosynthesis protein TsaE